MTALELVNKLAVEKLETSDAIVTLATPNAAVAKLIWALNETQRALYDSFDYVKLKRQGNITLVTDTTVYDLATDFDRFIKGEDAAYYTKVKTGATAIAKFTITDDEGFKNHTVSNADEGRPYIGRLFGMKAATLVSQIEVYGTPTATYNGTKLYYEYIRRLDDLATDADLSPFPDHLMIDGAYIRMSVKNGDASEADFVAWINAKTRSINNDSAGRKRKLKYRDW